MAPVLSAIDIPDLKLSSLELDSRSSKSEPFTKRGLFLSDPISNPLLPRNEDASPILSPMDTFNVLTARDAKSTTDPNPGAGSIDPNSINMKGIQALFALIGAAFVLGAIWFFFWAKNGGFQWRKGDWEDYKSTVLRRKGPNGTTLSNATKSTILGGGSVVGDGYSDKDAAPTVDGTMTETMTDLSSEAPIIKGKRQSKAKKETAKERKVREAKEAQWEGAHDNDVRAYRHEKAARVGGLNKDSDAIFYGTDYTETDRSTSDMASNSNSNRQTSAYGYEAGHGQSARKSSPDKRQTQTRRDFSYSQEQAFNVSSPAPAATATTASQAPRPPRYHSPSKNPGPQRPIRSVPGSFTEPLDFDAQSQNTKSYHHPLPNLNGQAKSGGYRRDRRDSLDD